jgi:hypothetical protein
MDEKKMGMEKGDKAQPETRKNQETKDEMKAEGKDITMDGPHIMDSDEGQNRPQEDDGKIFDL